MNELGDVATVITIAFAFNAFHRWITRKRHGLFLLTILYMSYMFILIVALIGGYIDLENMERHEKIIIWITAIFIMIRFSSLMDKWFG